MNYQELAAWQEEIERAIDNAMQNHQNKWSGSHSTKRRVRGIPVLKFFAFSQANQQSTKWLALMQSWKKQQFLLAHGPFEVPKQGV